MREDTLPCKIHDTENANKLFRPLINKDNSKKDCRNETLLSLSRGIALVKTPVDLLNIIDNSLTKLMHFNHGVLITSSDDETTYKASFLTEATLSKEHSSHNEITCQSSSICDDVYNLTLTAYQPQLCDIRSFDLARAPQWLKLLYAAGAREMLVKTLPNNARAKHSLIFFADKIKSFNNTSIEIIESLTGQFTKAIKNIKGNEVILAKERDKQCLLKFATDLAAVRTKADLEAAIFDVLDRMIGIKLSMIRLIQDDGIILTPYLYDKNAVFKDDDLFRQLLSKNITINEPSTAKVLQNDAPVIFNIEEELDAGNNNPYVLLWKKTGKKNMYGSRLRVGNENIGTLWLLADDLNHDLVRGLCSQISVAISNIKANEKLLAYKNQLEVENDHLKEQIKAVYNFSEIIGQGSQMAKVYRLMSRVVDTGSTVLILGETGTGKELIARGIHNASLRKNKLMVKVNCAALPPNLIESELFGHEKGSFTGAFEQRIGKFELAHGGTLFLDEVGELPMELQVKLLRVIQEREFERVGGKKTIKVDVRIIAATNRNLETEIAAGKFRSDLYYRLNVFPINLPPLRERTEDIALLANFFVKKYSKLIGYKITSIAPKVLQQLKSYLWPGNIRELEHIIERSILMANDHALREVHLPNLKQTDKEMMSPFNQTIEDMERNHIISTLKQCRGKISGSGGAAGVLDIQPTTLHSKMRKLNITKQEYFKQVS